MTLVNIIKQALIELGRTTDAQQMEEWRQKFSAFVNDGMRDIAAYLELRKTDTVSTAGGSFRIADLSGNCVKIIGVRCAGEEVPYYMGRTSGEILVPGCEEAEVTYRYIPNMVKDNTDQPELPEHLHNLLVSYVVYREHLTADPTMQRRANAFYQMYETGKRQARKTYGEDDAFSFCNVGW